jgi:hypothetical protein|tara:strand:+ start:159 stop:368 length:210 start_codon:yes stop_codon:yes gene_type:complete
LILVAAIFLFWPNAGTLATQARRNDICEASIKQGAGPHLRETGQKQGTASDSARSAKQFELADYLDSLE